MRQIVALLIFTNCLLGFRWWPWSWWTRWDAWRPWYGPWRARGTRWLPWRQRYGSWGVQRRTRHGSRWFWRKGSRRAAYGWHGKKGARNGTTWQNGYEVSVSVEVWRYFSHKKNKFIIYFLQGRPSSGTARKTILRDVSLVDICPHLFVFLMILKLQFHIYNWLVWNSLLLYR